MSILLNPSIEKFCPIDSRTLFKQYKPVSQKEPFSVPNDFTSELINDCVGGTYYLSSKSGKRIAVFKPSDEEPGCMNNPKRNQQVIKEGVAPGKGALREVLAYELDHLNFAKVPRTKMVELEIKGEMKVGSMQVYVENDGTMDDYGSGLFTIENVQRIAQFDLRTLNMDRHNGNFLVVNNDSSYELVPIDHSYILPERLDGARFDWVHWKQVSMPIVPVVAQYIQNIDIDKEVELLMKMKLSKVAIDNLKIMTLFLKKACLMQWTFKMMADYVCKNGNEKTKLEGIVEKAKTMSTDQQSFWYHYNAILNDNIHQQ
jgi:hypothetical protein